MALKKITMEVNNSMEKKFRKETQNFLFLVKLSKTRRSLYFIAKVSIKFCMRDTLELYFTVEIVFQRII